MMTEQTLARLEEFISQPDKVAWRSFLDQSEIAPKLGWLVQTLATKIDFYNRSEPQRSLELAELALMAAETGSDKGSLGLACRAKAHALRAVGRYQEALPYYARAAQLFKQSGQTSEEGRTYIGELAALSSLGHYAECLQKGVAIRRRLARLADSLNLAKLDSNLAIVNHQLGRYASALRQHNRAIREFERLGQFDLIPATRVNRANTLWQLNRFRKAAADYMACRADFEKKGLKALVAIVDTNLGFLLFSQGRYNDALELLTTARNGFEETGQPDKRALAEVDLAYCYSALGLYNEALAYYEQASATLAQTGMKYEVLRAELGRAQVLLNEGKLELASLGLKQVIETYATANLQERNRHALAVAWFYRAQLFSRAGYTLEALGQCRQAKAVFNELKLADWYTQSALLEADLLCQNGRANEAEQAYREIQSSLTRLKLPHLFYQLYYGLGKLHQARLVAGLTPAAQLEEAQAARREFLRASEQIETIRAILRPEELRSAFMENGLSAYESLVKLCLQPPLSEQPGSLEEAFNYVERSKSRSLLDLLSQNLSRASANFPVKQTKYVERVDTLREELNWFYSQLHSQSGTNPLAENRRPAELASEEIEKIGRQVEVREEELSRLLRSSRSHLFDGITGDPNYASPPSSDRLLSELRVNLEEEQGLLEYYVLEGKVLAFWVTKTELKVFYPLCEVSQLTVLQERLNFQANKFNLGTDYVERHQTAMKEAVNHYLARLYELLIAPLKPKITTPRFVIVPHGTLHSLPFHAFYDGQRYLIETYEVSYAPSAVVFLHCQRPPRPSLQKLLAVGISDLWLDGIKAEVQQLSAYFPEAHLLTGENATLAALKEKLEWCDVLHLASHGVFREDNPLFSLLKLADSWLSVHDIMEWQFAPELVTLSACQTGLSRSLRGDELLGLARGFLSAGAKSLVVSLWSVSDTATSHLMCYFYEELSKGLGRAAALRQAMLRLKAQPQYSHPYYWAPFLLIGRP